MRNLIIGIIIGIILASTVSAVASNIGSESLWNNVYNSSTQTIKIIGV